VGKANEVQGCLWYPHIQHIIKNPFAKALPRELIDNRLAIDRLVLNHQHVHVDLDYCISKSLNVSKRRRLQYSKQSLVTTLVTAWPCCIDYHAANALFISIRNRLSSYAATGRDRVPERRVRHQVSQTRAFVVVMKG